MPREDLTAAPDGQNAGQPRPLLPRIARNSGDSASLQKSRTRLGLARLEASVIGDVRDVYRRAG